MDIGAAFLIIPFQLLGLILTFAFQLSVFEHVGPLMPLAILYFSTVFAYLFLSRTREGWPQKEVRLKEAVRSATAFFVFVLLIYGGVFLLREEWDRVLISPLVALATALAALILSLVAGDTAALILELPEENEKPQRLDRWS